MRTPALALALLLAACGGSPPAGVPGDFAPAPGGPFAERANPGLQLPRCVLPGGTIGLPDPVPDPLPVPDRGNGLAADVVTDAPDSLPAQVPLRTDRQTYNRRYQFALASGRIWFKSNTAVTGIVQPWAELPLLPPCLAGTLIGIAADDDELIAIRADGAIYGMDRALADYTLFNWSSRWGPPLWTGTGHAIPPDYLAWTWSVISQAEDHNWTDPAGNRHAIGAGKVSHIWLLREGGQRYTYVDPWLPRDDSYEMCGPRRGRFRGVNVSASGSTVFTVNRFGDLYTRHYDFDLAGADDLFFDYSYEDQRGLANPAIQLPTFDWLQQPKVPGAITHDIGIHKLGADMQERILRVEGLDAAGHAGYWEKPYADPAASAWRFVRTDAPLRGTLLDNRPRDSSLDDAGPAEDARYARNMENLATLGTRPQVTGDADWAAELVDFNFYCSPARLRVWLSADETLDLLLHATDAIRQGERGRGLDGNPRAFPGAIELPAATHAALEALPPKSREFVALYLGDGRWTPVDLTGVAQRISFDAFGWEFERGGPP